MSTDDAERSETAEATETPDARTAADSNDAPLLELEDLEVHFESGGMIRRLLGDTTVQAVDGVDLELEERDIVVLVGESGCGKTTLGKAAVGLQRPTGGSVRYRGQDIWEAKSDPRSADVEFSEIRRALQIVHQDPSTALNSSRRIEAILADPLKKWRPDLDAEERTETIYQYLEYVDMTPPEDYADRYPHQLSGGEQQRITLGRALLMNPDVILADEAVSALDVSLRVEMMDLILDLQETFDTSYLFISHDLANARYLAKRTGGRIAIMYLGKIVEVGTADEVLEDPTHPYTKVLRWATPSIDPDIAAEEIEAEPPVRSVDVPDPADPPSGCPFHTRCPDAREVCTRETPDAYDAGATRASCFRALEDHEYWSSPELEAEGDGGPGMGEAEFGTSE